MTGLVKLIIGVCIACAFGQNNPINETKAYEPIASTITRITNSKKTRAFVVLTNKCNVCHHKRNRSRVFTEDNMERWAKDVYEQVFIKKRMPKGKKIKLTNDEYQDLLTWISSIKNN